MSSIAALGLTMVGREHREPERSLARSNAKARARWGIRSFSPFVLRRRAASGGDRRRGASARDRRLPHG